MKHQYHHYDEAEQVSKWAKVASKLPDLFLKAGVAYAGIKATGHWTGALTALVGLRLAEANNLTAGGAGVAILAGVGLGNLNMAYDEARAQKYWEQFEDIGLVLPYWMIPP